MTGTLYLLNVSLHVFAALVWLGGMFFFALIGVPVLREIEPPELRALLFKRLGVRARNIGWIAIGVLLVTGVVNLHFRSVLSADLLSSGAFWRTTYGNALAWKLGSVAVMILISAFHDFVYGPAASRLTPGSPEAIRARRRASWLGRINAIVGMVIIIAAVRLARGF